jgi:hypothetical protein
MQNYSFPRKFPKFHRNPLQNAKMPNLQNSKIGSTIHLQCQSAPSHRPSGVKEHPNSVHRPMYFWFCAPSDCEGKGRKKQRPIPQRFRSPPSILLPTAFQRRFCPLIAS